MSCCEELLISDGHKLDVYLQKCHNKKSAIRLLTQLLGCYPTLRVIITDKLNYIHNNFFRLTAVCKTNSPVIGANDNNIVLPQCIWAEIFDYLKLSDVVLDVPNATQKQNFREMQETDDEVELLADTDSDV